MTALEVLIVDDEPLARRSLRRALEDRPEVHRLVEFSDGLGALEHLRQDTVDLAYLDVRMPGIGGFEVARRLGPERMPPFVFVTAHDDFAVEAFEVRALDYLLKPFTASRFEESFRRSLDRLRARTPNGPSLPGRVRIKMGGHTTFVPLDEVVWFEAANTYVRVHTRDRVHLVRDSLSSLERALDPRFFARVHRSAVVRLSAVVEMTHRVRGDYELVLENGDRVRASRRRREELMKRLIRPMPKRDP